MVVLPMAIGNSHLKKCVSFILLEIKYSTFDNFACDNIRQLLDKIVNVTFVTISRSLFLQGQQLWNKDPSNTPGLVCFLQPFFILRSLYFLIKTGLWTNADALQ